MNFTTRPKQPAIRDAMISGLEATSAIFITLGGLFLTYFLKSRKPVPPSLPAELVSGNLHQLPTSASWETYAQWSKDLKSPVVSYRLFTQRVTILNSIKAINDLLQSRASIYSDRPFSWMLHELVGRKLSVFDISSENPRFKIYRKLVQTGLNPRSVQSYRGILESERNILLRNLESKSGKNFISYIKQNAAGIILAVTYGWTVTNTDDILISSFEEAVKIQGTVTKPGYLVEFIPLLRFVPSWFPGAHFKREAKRFRKDFSRIESSPFVWTKEQIASGDYIESFTSRHLQEVSINGGSPEDEDVVKWASAALYVGGADTVVAALSSFILFMIHYPEIQRRAQAEIDKVIRTGRLPTLEDQGKLVYVNGVLKEVLRVAPVAPLGLPHRLVRDDEYIGFSMPKGSVVIANIWGAMRDPTVYPEPDKFDPERFLPPNNQMDSRKLAFGFGQRTCPGIHLAEATFFLNASSLLAAFTLAKPLDEKGNEVELTGEYFDISTIPVNHPKPFDCRFIVRSPELIPVA